MASHDIEVEIKVPLSKQELPRVRAAVRKMAKLVQTFRQVDEYFTPAHRNFVKPKYPFEWLRLRTSGNKTILNYKHLWPQNSKITTHCDEFETQVEKPKQLKKILSSLDFKGLVVIDKTRDLYRYENRFDIALDTVINLGYFIEIEALKDFGGPKATRTKLNALAQLLKLDLTNQDFRGYPYLLMKKKGLIK